MVEATAATAAAPRLEVEPSRRRLRFSSSPAALSPSNSNSNANADAAAAAAATARKPKPKVKTVASRYLTLSSSISSSSSTSTTTSSRRFASPAPRRPAGELSRPVLLPNAATATRTLSVAFQSPSYSLDTSKARPVSPDAVAAAIAPEKRRSSACAAPRGKVPDVRWPAAANAAPYGFGGGALTKRQGAASILVAARSTAFDEAPRRASVDGGEYLQALSSDTETTSSAESQDGGGGALILSRAGPSPRSIVSSSARFLRDTVGSRSDRFAGQATPFMPRTSAVASSSPRTAPVKKKSLFDCLLSSPFNRSSLRQQSPIKPAASSPRRTASPSPVTTFARKLQGKGSTHCNLDTNMRRKTPGDHKADDEHRLRVLQNWHLQWRHANAQADATLSVQTMAAEKYLCGAWIAVLGMHRSVALRKDQIQLFKNDCKVMAILRGQMTNLEEWSLLEEEHADSLAGTVEALNATILLLPVSDGAVADIQDVKNAASSAIDAMQTIRNSTSTLLSKLSRANVLVSQLSKIAVEEHDLMAQCRELLCTLASMHVKYKGKGYSLPRECLGVSRPERSPFRLLLQLDVVAKDNTLLSAFCLGTRNLN